ncbi:GYF domain-containing protein [Rubinisphaera sp. JC750]|uniref:GYF domain-containing protein n=1 Tax=Rubinisphaera sp. JC750 TaxID=2898658 RepID=UPI001F4898E1|nr:GYF domain-containing protein [Rubinisphaera sp. JC750]
MDNEQTKYLIRLRGKTRGPFAVSQLRQMHARGQFGKLHQISSDGTDWRSASTLLASFSGKQADQREPEPEQAPAPSESADWYYVLENQRLGPVTESQLRHQLREEYIPGVALVWQKGMDDWIEAAEAFPDSLPDRRTTSLLPGLLTVAIALCVAAGIGGAIWYWQQSSSATLTPLLRRSGEIHSMDLADAGTHAQVHSAIGMVVCYAEIIQKTGERHERPFGHGTCFLVTPDGYAITNRHVVDGHQEWVDASEEGRILKLIRHNTLPEETSPALVSADVRNEFNKFVNSATSELIGRVEPRLRVYFGEESYPATVAAISRRFDMAVLKIEDFPTGKSFFSLSKQSTVPQSTAVVALGFPGVSQMAVTEDEAAVMASSSNKKNVAELLFGNDDHRSEFKTSAFDFVQTPGEVSVVQKETGDIYNIQHTAAIRQGNSGGPLVYREGQSAGTVVGINTIFLSHEAPVFIAFPVAQMRDELEKTIGASKLVWR